MSELEPILHETPSDDIKNKYTPVVINTCYGGFGLSTKLCKRLNLAPRSDDISRTDPNLIEAVLELGEEANGKCAKLEVVYILKGEKYQIAEYDGKESIKLKRDELWETA